MIRIILKRYKYPPDKAAEALDMVMKQAEVLSDEWSRECNIAGEIYRANSYNDSLLLVAEQKGQYNNE